MKGVSVVVQDGKIAEIGAKLGGAEGRAHDRRARACACIRA